MKHCKIFTIPNILSFLRLAMIPFIVWLYCFAKNYTAAGILLIASGLTDIADGFIARHFHMISDLGKALDPIADKLTQGTVLICLATRFPLILIPLCLLLAKELFMGVTGCIIIRQVGIVPMAVWHGKVATALLYVTMILHIFWINIPHTVSGLFILLCGAGILLSFFLYASGYVHLLKDHKAKAEHAEP